MYQSITIAGRLGRDPESKFTQNGEQICSFSVAVDRSYTKGSERVKETTWFRVTVFGKQAEACNKFLAKGRAVLVEGRLGIDAKTGGPRVYTTKEGGAAASFDVIANTVRFIERPQGGDASSAGDIDF